MKISTPVATAYLRPVCLVCCGERLELGEAINLQPQDVDWSEGVLTVRGGEIWQVRGLFRSTRPHARCLCDYAKRRAKIFNRLPVPYFFW